MYETIDNACDEIIQADLPIVFIDTCVYLNVLNSFHHKDLQDKYIYAATDLIGMNQRKCIIVACELVKDEFERNIDAVTKNLRNEIVSSHNTIQNILNFIDRTEPSKSTTSASLVIPRDKAAMSDIAEIIKKAALNFLNTSKMLAVNADHRSKAMIRMMREHAPSRKGKAEPGDCLITEVFLDMCTQLRTKGFNRKIIFLTYNKDDFGGPGALKTPLDIEFSNVNVDYIGDICHAAHIIK